MSTDKPSVNDELNLQVKLQAEGKRLMKQPRKPPKRETWARNKAAGKPVVPALLLRNDDHSWRSRALVHWPRGIAPEDAPPQFFDTDRRPW